MKKGQLLNIMALLMSVMYTLSVSAYDFEVEGIYYNKTSSNTVEVTYRNIGDNYYGGSFGESIVIPNTVTYNGRNYTVTAIGDSAFKGIQVHGSERIFDITIPETITLIGKDAFTHIWGGFRLTCLAKIPPEMEGAFDEQEDYDNEFKFPFGLFENDYFDFFGYNFFEYESMIVLYVPSEAYHAYKEVNDNYHYFSWILGNDWEKTATPSVKVDYSYSLERRTGFSVTFTPNEVCRIYYSAKSTGLGWHSWYPFEPALENDTVIYFACPTDDKPSSYLFMLAAVAEGKLPSDIFVFANDPYSIYCEEYIWPPYHCYFDFQNADIFYTDDCANAFDSYFVGWDIADGTIVGDNIWVSRGKYVDPCESNEDGIIEHHFADYSGDIVIPTKVRGYNVVGVKEYAFTDCDEMTGLSVPLGCAMYHVDLSGCTSLKKLMLPVGSSIDFYYYDNEEAYNIESIYIYGDGNLDGYYALPESVKSLYLGSGVSKISSLYINPKTIYSYATTPPDCKDLYDDYYEGTFDYDAELHVPASSLAAYFTAPHWCNFTNIIGDIIPISDFSLGQDSISILKGSQFTFDPIITPAHVVPDTIIWQSTDMSVATVKDGVVSAVGTGECEIQAICQGKFVICRVYVTELLPTEVVLSQENAQMEVGGQLTLTATVLPVNSTYHSVNWSSSNPWVAKVSNGVVTAVGEGECDIYASCHGQEAVCHVVVVDHFITISLDQHEASLLPNHILTLTPTATPASTDLKVTSSNPAVAAARMAGNKIQVVGIQEGEAMIIVQPADRSADADTCHVTVYTELGDVNCDGYVDILDVTLMVDLLLDENSSSCNLENADCDMDGVVGIQDVTVLIDALLSGKPLPDKEVRTFIANGVTFKMVRVRGGTFTMGTTEEEDSDHTVFVASPPHQVTLSDYSIGQTEVTYELWYAVMGGSPSNNDVLQCPMYNVNWNECQTFINQLNELTGMNFRLPTEAEWEFAARGGTKSKGYIYAGSDNLDEVAWYNENSNGISHPVATKKPNELGLYDMNGNIEEWINDWYSLYTADPVTNPTGPETGMSRVHRGGRWNASYKVCRITRRDGFSPGVKRNYMGLRLAL